MNNDWATAIQELRQSGADKVPPNWITSEILGKQIGITTNHAASRLRLLVDNGKAERKQYRIQAGEVVRPVYHYKLK